MTSGLPPPRGVALLGFRQLRKIPAAAFRRSLVCATSRAKCE